MVRSFWVSVSPRKLLTSALLENPVRVFVVTLKAGAFAVGTGVIFWIFPAVWSNVAGPPARVARCGLVIGFGVVFWVSHLELSSFCCTFAT